ncbi:MAG: molecular chaperone DnaJ [Gaiellaceae bacterium]|jgi:molecular chaperone DnaJ|nr:molecular chaperone DnaJ [Gaiellaceae bacterium]
MATTRRDYYELLGVSREAGDGEIKKAFRRLARTLHPDVSNEPDAEERFRQVVEAYEVLSKPEARQLYDRYGHEGLSGGGFTPTSFDFGSLADLFGAFFGDDIFASGGRATGRARGADVVAQIEIELTEAAQGTTRRVPFPATVTCTTCSGSGAKPGTEPVMCGTCGGRGRLQQVSRTAFGEFVRSQACPACGGAGRVVEDPCLECEGSGRIVEERTLEVEVPPGIHDGQQIRMTGEGHAGSLGGRAGDVYVQVRVNPDPRFVREGNDIFCTVDLTMTDAALGTTVKVPTLEGEIELEVEPGTQPGKLHVLKGRGMPVLQGFGRGNQRILLNVQVPKRLTDEQRRLLEEFERSAGAETYEADEGFFQKLKSAFR